MINKSMEKRIPLFLSLYIYLCGGKYQTLKINMDDMYNEKLTPETLMKISAPMLLLLALREDNDKILAKEMCKVAESKFKKALLVDPHKNELLFKLGMTLMRHEFLSEERQKVKRIANALDRFKASVADQDGTLKKASSCSMKKLWLVMDLKRSGSILLAEAMQAPSWEAQQLFKKAKAKFQGALRIDPTNLNALRKMHLSRFYRAERYGAEYKMKRVRWDWNEARDSIIAAQGAAEPGRNLSTPDSSSSSSNPFCTQLLAILWPNFQEELDQENRARQAEENIGPSQDCGEDLFMQLDAVDSPNCR